jgi:hypothetical protein
MILLSHPIDSEFVREALETYWILLNTSKS